MFIPIERAKIIKNRLFPIGNSFYLKQNDVLLNKPYKNLFEDYRLLHAMLHSYWYINNFIASNKSDKCSFSNEMVVDYEYNSSLSLMMYEHVVVQEVEQDNKKGIRKLINMSDFTEFGWSAISQYYDSGYSISTSHFFPIRKLITESTESVRNEVLYFLYTPSKVLLTKELESELDEDSYMQFLIQNDYLDLPATNYTLKELNNDPFIYYLATHVHKLYLIVDPNVSNYVDENINNFQSIKRLIWI